MIRCCHDLGSVFDDHYRIALIPDRVQHLEKPRDIARMKTDRGLVEHVEGRREHPTEGRRQLDALCLPSGEGAHLAVQAQVGESHPVRGSHPGCQGLVEATTSGLRGGREFERREPGIELAEGHSSDLADLVTAHLDLQRLGAEPGSPTHLARIEAAVARDLHAGLDLVATTLEPLEEAAHPVPGFSVSFDHQ